MQMQHPVFECFAFGQYNFIPFCVRGDRLAHSTFRNRVPLKNWLIVSVVPLGIVLPRRFGLINIGKSLRKNVTHTHTHMRFVSAKSPPQSENIQNVFFPRVWT